MRTIISMKSALVLSMVCAGAAMAAGCSTDTGGGAATSDATDDTGGTLSDGTGGTDAGAKDATKADGGVADAGKTDAGKADAGTVDAGGGEYCQVLNGFNGGPAGDIAASCSPGYFCKANTAGMCGGGGKCTKLPELCPASYGPVCGCDGKEYANGCVANSKGVNMAYGGKCKTATQCIVPGKASSSADPAPGAMPAPVKDCGAGSFCAGACGQGGTCKTKPTACTKIYKPVCGCDGKTYSNACMANAAGAAVQYAGQCKAPKSCYVPPKGTGAGFIPAPAPQPCDAGQYCQLPTLQCGGSGVCVDLVKGAGCAAVYDPVCGCDGKTYGNACSAGLAGINVASKGKCKAPPTQTCCSSAKDCGLGATCVGSTPNIKGVCKGLGNPMLGACWDDSQCGNGNICVGASVCPCGATCLVADKQGTCKPKSVIGQSCSIGGGATSIDCGGDAYCNLTATSNSCSGTGTCTAKPQACTMQYAPVCGCDGKTYGNACSAAGAGANVAYKGTCSTP